jgi:hypothetical protein
VVQLSGGLPGASVGDIRDGRSVSL